MREADEFVGETMHPAAGSFDTRSMAAGGPGVPARFTWRGREFAVADVLESWKTTGACSHGSRERYVRKHWFVVRTACGEELTITYDRRAATPRAMREAWRVHSRRAPTEAGDGGGVGSTIR